MKGFSSDSLPAIGNQVLANVLPQLKLCDIGVNLLDEMFQGKYRNKNVHDDDTIDVLERAKSMGVVSMIITAGNVEESIETLKFCRRISVEYGLYSTVGVHPTRSNVFKTAADQTIDELRAIIIDGISDGKVKALGELGLDYDRLHFSGKEAQMIGFQRQLELAGEFSLPLFLHDRNTAGDFYRIIKENREKLSRGGVVHSFTGTLEEMKAFAELGFYIGINGCSLKTDENLLVVKEIPIELLLLETDAPWCGIKNTHAGSGLISTKFLSSKKEKFKVGTLVKDRNEPCTMIQVLEVVARVRNVDPFVLSQIVYQNTQRLFGI